MFEMKSSLVTLLVVFSLSLLASGAAGNERKRWQSVFKTIMELGDPSKGPTVSLEFVGQELEKWIDVEDSDKNKFLGTESAKIMDRLIELNLLTRGCDNNHLKYRFAMEQGYNHDYVNLHPYIKFANSILFNICYQDYEYQLMLLLNDDLDESKLIAWFEATVGEIDEQSSRMATLRLNIFGQRDPNLTGVFSKARELQIVAGKLALYLKHFYPQIESKYFNSATDHADKIKSEVETILNAVCPRITKLNTIFASGQEQATTSPEEIPSISMMHGQTDAEFHSLMKDVARNIDDEAFAHLGMYKYHWICQELNWKQLVANVQRYFSQFLDELESEDRITDDSAEISQQDLIATDEILFTRDDYPKLRMGHQYVLINRLYVGLNDRIKARLPYDLHKLMELHEISEDECLVLNSKLGERLGWEMKYDNSYVVLYPFIASLNGLQFDLCNQRLRQLASRTIPGAAVRLAKLEKLRTLFESETHELVDPDDFAKAVADLLFLSSTCKIPTKLVASKMQELLEETCGDFSESPSVTSLLERHDVLINYGLMGPLNDATKRALSYSRICKYYELNKSQLSPQLFNPDGWFKTAPQRHPNHLSRPSLLACLKPQVNE